MGDIGDAKRRGDNDVNLSTRRFDNDDNMPDAEEEARCGWSRCGWVVVDSVNCSNHLDVRCKVRLLFAQSAVVMQYTAASRHMVRASDDQKLYVGIYYISRESLPRYIGDGQTKKLSCLTAVVRCCVSLLSHARSLKVIRNDILE